ncbi:MAG: TraB/GumN family protein [Planctomycetota bacterium]
MHAVARRLALVFAAALPSLAPTAVRAEDAAPAPAPAPAAKPDPYLWVVEGPTRIFLFGTIHLPDPRVMDFPKVVRDAHAAADVVWGELSLDDQDSPKVQAAMFLPGKQTLKDVVPAATYEKLQAYLKARGTPPMIVERMKPIWASVVLGLLDALPLLASAEPMDKLLLKEAAAAGKETGGLEVVEEQLQVFEAASAEAQARFLDQTVADLEQARAEGKKPVEAMIKAYAEGDLAGLHDQMAKMSASDDPDVKALAKRLLDDRNVLMVDRLLARAAKAPEKTYFVLVGAGHYPGPEGILALLEKKGLKARRLAADAALPAAPAPAAK